jgi:hypothetical protein
MTMTVKFDPKICANPQAWAYMELQKAASLMDWTKNCDITDWRYVPIYRMLMGFSMENLLKGILIAEDLEAVVDGKLNSVLDSHGLKDLAEKIGGLKFTKLEKRVLSELESYVLWAGRYPAPKKAVGIVRIGHSPRVHSPLAESAN